MSFGIEVRRLLRHRLAARGVARAPARPSARARGRRARPRPRRPRRSPPRRPACTRRPPARTARSSLRVELVVGVEPEEVARPVHRERVGVPDRGHEPERLDADVLHDAVGREDLEARDRATRRAPRRCASPSGPPRGRRPRSRSGGGRRRSGAATSSSMLVRGEPPEPACARRPRRRRSPASPVGPRRPAGRRRRAGRSARAAVRVARRSRQPLLLRPRRASARAAAPCPRSTASPRSTPAMPSRVRVDAVGPVVVLVEPPERRLLLAQHAALAPVGERRARPPRPTPAASGGRCCAGSCARAV